MTPLSHLLSIRIARKQREDKHENIQIKCLYLNKCKLARCFVRIVFTRDMRRGVSMRCVNMNTE